MALFTQQEREEEEREEAARLDAQKLEGAFNNLDFDDGDSSLCSPPGWIRYKGHGFVMVTPGPAAQLKNLTCTLYGQGEKEMFGNMEHEPLPGHHPLLTTTSSSLIGLGKILTRVIV